MNHSNRETVQDSEIYRERTAASKLCENSRNSVRVSPSNMSEWEQLSKTLTIAWVAQALLMTWNDRTHRKRSSRTDVKNTQEAESLTRDAARRIMPQQNQMPSPAGCQIQRD